MFGVVAALVNAEDSSLHFLHQNPVDAILAIELSQNEHLLVFSSLGFYVDDNGRRKRKQELMWPAHPLAASKSLEKALWLKSECNPTVRRRHLVTEQSAAVKV